MLKLLIFYFKQNHFRIILINTQPRNPEPIAVLASGANLNSEYQNSILYINPV